MEVKNPAYTHNRLIIIKLSKKCKQMGIEQLNFVGNDGLVQPFREDVAFVRPLLPFPDHLLQHIRILSSYIIPLSSVFFNIIQFPLLHFFILYSFPIFPPYKTIIEVFTEDILAQLQISVAYFCSIGLYFLV